MSTVTACAYDATASTDTIATYFAKDARHERMADYLAGAASMFGLEVQLPMAIAALEEGADFSPNTNWMQLGTTAQNDFVTWYNNNDSTGQSALTATSVVNCDALNAAAGTWWLAQKPNCGYSDWKGAISQASAYNGTCGCSCPYETAYGWSAMFLAYGGGYAIPGYTYNDAYYVTGPTGTQNKYSNSGCGSASSISVPSFTPTYATRSTTYGTNADAKQVAILAGTDTDYVSGLQVALEFFSQVNTNINVGVWAAPMVLAGNRYAARMTQNSGTNVVVVIGATAKSGIETAASDLGLTCVAYSSYSAWAAGSSPGYIDCSSGTDQENYTSAYNNAVSAANSGSY